MTRLLLPAFLFIPFISFVHAAQPGGPPIVALKAKPNDSVFKDSSFDKPIVLKSADDAAKHFDKDALAALMKEVDFTKQVVLVFAWKGSGGDKLKYTIAESFPEQIFFSRTLGLTRDLRSHVHVFALRANVRWSVQGKAGKEKASVRPIKFDPQDPTLVFKIGGMSKATTLTDVTAVENLLGKASAKALVAAVDFEKEKLVLVSWTTSGPPDGVLKSEVKMEDGAPRIVFYVQGPPGGGARGQRARIGADFFAVPRDATVSFDAKER